jgi:hypothetical protein
MIKTREELINALTEAAELEHSFLVQYLFAAFSFKRRADEGVSELQLEKMRDWEATILSVAREEMAHLGTVCNLLISIGGAAQLRRMSFPDLPNKYFPFESKLEKFNLISLERFIGFETPVKPPSAFKIREVAPEPIEFDKVGILYETIKQGFIKLNKELSSSSLFMLPFNNNQIDDWSASMKIYKISNLIDAIKAIDSIVEEGEGARSDKEDNHYNKFKKIFKQYKEELDTNPNFQPARNVASNPITVDYGKPNTTLIPKSSLAFRLAGLFNTTYNTAILMLMQYYELEDSHEHKKLLQSSSRQIMSAIIRPLAEILTEVQIEDNNDLMAGAPFEFYTDLQIGNKLENNLIIIKERLTEEANECFSLLKNNNQLNRLKFIGDNLSFLSKNFEL